MSNFKPFKFWAQKVLPLVYDESLSYYEIICKLVDRVNELTNVLDKEGENILKQNIREIINNLIVEAMYDEPNKRITLKFVDTSIVEDGIHYYDSEKHAMVIKEGVDTYGK